MRAASLVAIAILGGVAVLGQDNSAGMAVYKVDFRIQDAGDASASGGRRYTIMVTQGAQGIFRLGQKVPYATGSSQANGSTVVNTQFQYAEVGVNIDCRVHDELNHMVRLNTNLEMSSVLTNDRSAGAPATPTIAQSKVVVDALLVPAKPTLIASVNDPATKRRLDVEATVTRTN